MSLLTALMLRVSSSSWAHGQAADYAQPALLLQPAILFVSTNAAPTRVQCYPDNMASVQSLSVGDRRSEVTVRDAAVSKQAGGNGKSNPCIVSVGCASNDLLLMYSW